MKMELNVGPFLVMNYLVSMKAKSNFVSRNTRNIKLRNIFMIYRL